MEIAKVVKRVVSTIKHDAFVGRPLLLVQPLTMDFSNKGPEVLCVDFMGAGVNETVLIMKEGGSVNDLLGTKNSPADAAIVAIVDSINFNERKIFEKSNAQAA